ncbi:hypothetical protein, partial [Pelagicoccus sp. SDUM812002]|uniref:hypothetical protein n=1 Tax=Pelagicoccus sp. SDUM812002 TaxID=3041266 RepID=UPI0028124CEA
MNREYVVVALFDENASFDSRTSKIHIFFLSTNVKAIRGSQRGALAGVVWAAWLAQFLVGYFI